MAIRAPMVGLTSEVLLTYWLDDFRAACAKLNCTRARIEAAEAALRQRA